LRNLLLITGDPGRVGDYPDATAVFDVDSIGLTNVVSRLNHGSDVGGQAIGAPTAFHIGVSINPAAHNLDEELRRFEYKVEAGAEFVITRPVFDVPRSSGCSSASNTRGCRSLPACFRSKAPATPNSWPTKCPASAYPTAHRPDARCRRRRSGDGRRCCDRARHRARAAAGGPGRAGVHPAGDTDARMAVLDGLR
jgi:hypothetical protein